MGQTHGKGWNDPRQRPNRAYGHGTQEDADMKPLKRTSADMVKDARARIKEIDTKDLIAMVDDPDVVIVDIRDIRER